jgi:putative transposase
MTRRCERRCGGSLGSGRGGGIAGRISCCSTDGWVLNIKRTRRGWREEGLRVPRKRRKRQRLGESTVPAVRLRAQHADHVWAIDFQWDQTADGHNLELLHVVDEFTREALAIECRRRIDADQTVSVLDRLVAEHGTTPGFVRCDKGPEMTPHALRDWCHFAKAGSAYIELGSPWQNPYVESFGGRVRDELLAVELFSCLTEARVLIEDWRLDYNHRRPHSALHMMTPAAFAAGLRRPLPPPTATTSGEGVEPRWPRPVPSGDPQPAASQPSNDKVRLRRSRHCIPTAAADTVAAPSHPPSSRSRWTDERAPVRVTGRGVEQQRFPTRPPTVQARIHGRTGACTPRDASPCLNDTAPTTWFRPVAVYARRRRAATIRLVLSREKRASASRRTSVRARGRRQHRPLIRELNAPGDRGPAQRAGRAARALTAVIGHLPSNGPWLMDPAD